MGQAIRIAPDRLEAWAADLLAAAGVPAPDAAEVAHHLVFADLRGIDSHGTSRLQIYLTRLEAGGMARETHPRVVKETSISALIDGGAGFGQVVARAATDMVIAKAREHGMAAVAVRGSSHCGCMAYYTLLMADAGLIGFATTKASPSMPPFGGKAAYFGTNPLAMAAPAAANPPFVFDMATSQVALGKVINAGREGKPIPEGWCITKEGLPTTDPQAALDGFVLPLGGAKGSALAFMVEILSSVLSGAPIGPATPRMYEDLDVPQQVGHFFLAFRPDLFLAEREFGARMDEALDGVRSVAAAPGFDQVLAPGDLERAREAENRRLGLLVAPGVVRDFRELGARYGVALPPELAVGAER